jgi:hypothetical protein
MPELLMKHQDFDPKLLNFPIYLLDLTKLTREDIDSCSDPRVQVLLTLLKERDLNKLVELRDWVAEKLLPLRDDPIVTQQFMNFIYYILHLTGPKGGVEKLRSDLRKFTSPEEADAMITELEKEYTARGLAEGKAIGLAEGVVQGKAIGLAEGVAEGVVSSTREGIYENLSLHFGMVPADILDKLNHIEDIIQLKYLRKEAVLCTSIEDFRTRL